MSNTFGVNWDSFITVIDSVIEIINIFLFLEIGPTKNIRTYCEQVHAKLADGQNLFKLYMGLVKRSQGFGGIGQECLWEFSRLFKHSLGLFGCILVRVYEGEDKVGKVRI